MKNAFSLIELLAIITILGIVAVITTTVVSSLGKDSKNALYETQKEMVVDAAKKWTAENDYKIQSDSYTLTLQELSSAKLLKSAKIADPRNRNNYLCGDVLITYNSTTNKYTYSYNPTSQTKCNTPAEILGITTVTSGDGIYNNGDGSYTFKGSSPANYISFNNEVWRIMSIDNQGIKIIRQDKLDTQRIFDIGSRVASSNSYCTSTSYCNAWAATKNLVGATEFTNGTFTGTVPSDSNLNIYLNGDYYKNTLNSNPNIIKGIFNVGPSDNESAFKWQGYVGLATTSEFLEAAYLGVGVGYNWWLITPTAGSNTGEQAAYWRGGTYNGGVNGNIGVRPVVYITSDVKITGSGTNDANIYKITS